MNDDRRHGNDPSDLEAAVTSFALTHPELGQQSVASALRERGINISPSGVRYLWMKRGLETTFKRLKAIERRRGNGGAAVLTESQRDLVRRGERAHAFARSGKEHGREEADGTIARRELILTGAAQLFVERGYAGTSMRDIASKVGLLAGSVYHYYPAKENLYLAVQKEGFRCIVERVERALAKESEPWRRLELACAEHIRSVVEGDAISRVTAIGLFAIHEGALQRRLKRDHDRYESIFRKLVESLPLRSGTDRSLLRLTLLGAMNWTLTWYKPGRISPAQIAARLVAMLRAGSSATPSVGVNRAGRARSSG